MKAITFLGVAVVLVACFAVPPTPATKPVTTTANSKPKINPVGGGGGPGPTGGGTGGGGTGGGGNANYTFEFYQPQSPNATVNVYLVSHSRVATDVGNTPANAKALLQYWIYDSNGALIAYVNDDVGGHHPNFFAGSSEAGRRSEALTNKINELVSGFVPIEPFTNYESKGNNHLPQFNKSLPTGAYTWVVHNKGNTKQRLFLGYANSETENVQINEIILADTTVTYNINIAFHPTDSAIPMKFNSNNYDL